MTSFHYQVLECTLFISFGSLLVLEFFGDEIGIHGVDAHFFIYMLTILGGVVLFLHRWRKELAAAYFSMGLVVLYQLYKWKVMDLDQKKHALHGIVIRLCALGFIVAMLSAWLFPLPVFCHLPGKYKTIGCCTKRCGGVECRIFYPSSMEFQKLPSSSRTDYLHHGHHLAKGLSIFTNLPTALFNNMSNARLWSVKDAPLATSESGKGWPVVIFSHGLAGSLELYSRINENLASEGYIVIVVNHCDGSACVSQPEDDVIKYYQTIPKAITADMKGAGYQVRHAQLQHRVEEIIKVLNSVELSKKEGKGLFVHANMNDINIWGHSFGGATAISTAQIEKRFRKVILLDTWMEPLSQEVLQGVGDRVPVLHVISEHFYRWEPHMAIMKKHMKGCTHPDSKLFYIEHTRHNDFSDIPLFSPTISRLIKSSGKLDSRRVLRITSLSAASFLRETFSLKESETMREMIEIK
jgi:platelet-activating factor acetylhydrolase